ncbi:MAG: hypothetical protein HZY73_10825 [Micropruina sp.]|nr:MAG: hypothetical protein HZY73_10825 [Micropruina sp.]
MGLERDVHTRDIFATSRRTTVGLERDVHTRDIFATSRRTTVGLERDVHTRDIFATSRGATVARRRAAVCQRVRGTSGLGGAWTTVVSGLRDSLRGAWAHTGRAR